MKKLIALLLSLLSCQLAQAQSRVLLSDDGQNLYWGGIYQPPAVRTGFRIGLSPGAALVYGNTLEAIINGIGTANASYDQLEFSDSAVLRARYVIPDTFTARWAGGPLTNTLHWYAGIGSTNGSVVWRVNMIGRTTNDVLLVAPLTQATVTNAVSTTTSNLNLSTLVFTPTNVTAGAVWMYEVQRLGNNSNDTMTGNANLISIGVWE